MHETDNTLVADEALDTAETPSTNTELMPRLPAPTLDPRAEAQAIAELCLLAGTPARTAEFLASGFTQAQVRSALLEAKSQQPEILSHITTEASTSSPNNLLMAATQKLTHKE